MPVHNPKLKGDWITNNAGHIAGYWPRRDALIVEGPPRATHKYTVEELQGQKIVGLYLDEDIPQGIKSRELLKIPKK